MPSAPSAAATSAKPRVGSTSSPLIASAIGTGNTPLAGRTLRGRVAATIFAGEVVHSLEGVGAL